MLCFFTLLGVCLACAFRSKLKKKEQELEFEMTDVRNVARINQPAANVPYYSVYEEENSAAVTNASEINKAIS